MSAPLPSDWLNEPAPAKINLYLHVVGRRADGYHLLDSLIAFAEVHDTLAVAGADGLELETRGPFASWLPQERPLPNGDGRGTENLVLCAARRLAEAGGVEPRAAIRLFKRLPVAAGIAGGSADAAAAIRALNRLWRLHAGPEDLMALALELGADVPVCLKGEAAFVGGIGERLAPAQRLPEAFLVLVNPGVKLMTGEVFAAREGAFSSPARFASAPESAAALGALLKERGNDLEPPARRLAPEVGEALKLIASLPELILARMSGSGATCFGLFAKREAAERGAARIAEARPGWWAVASAVVGRLEAVECLPAVGEA